VRRFLRIVGGENWLDNTPVHPESYTLAERIYELREELLKGLSSLDAAALAAELKAGLPTVRDIIAALAAAGARPA